MKIRFKSILTACMLAAAVFTASAYPVRAYEGFSDNCQTAEITLMPEDIELQPGYLPALSKYESNEKGFLFYDQLDNNNKAVYNAMKEWLVPSDKELTVSFPDSLSFTASSANMNNWTTEEYNAFWDKIFQNIVYGEKAVLLDYPEMFWFNTSPIKLTVGNIRPSLNFLTGKYTIRLSSVKMQATIKEEYNDIDTALKFKDMLEKSVENFEIEGSDRYQQVKYIHDYICNTVTYDVEAPYRDSATGIFCEPYKIVCEGYSKGFKLLCDKANIPCVSVPGNIDEETRVGHIWNYVMMEDNKWYAVDCTWDDIDNEGTGIKYTYFLKGSNSFAEKHTNEAGLSYPELNKTDYAYKGDPIVTTATTTSISETTSTTITAATTQEPVKPKGDYNNDGKVDVADIILLRRYITFNTSSFEYVADIDLNGDKRVDVFDCIILMRYVLKGV